MINEKANEIQYQFTAMPLNLTLCLDNNCRVMLFTLIQLSSHYANEDGYFFRTNEDLKAQTNFSENLVRATLSTLYDNGIVNVRSVGQAKGTIPNFFKVNFDKFTEWEKISIEDAIKNPIYKISTADYRQKGFKVSYLNALEDIVGTKDMVETIKKECPLENAIQSETIESTEEIQENKVTAVDDAPSPTNNLTTQRTMMDIAKEVVKKHRSQNTPQNEKQNTSPALPQSEDNINNKENKDNISEDSLKAIVERLSSQNNSPKTPLKLDDYKEQEDSIMDRLFRVKTWTDFSIIRKDYNALINGTPNPNWNEKTTKRFQKIEAGKMKYFAKMCANMPYNSMYDEIYQRTNCGWNKSPQPDEEEGREPQQSIAHRFGWVQDVESQPQQVESLDNQWNAICEKAYQQKKEREVLEGRLEKISMGIFDRDEAKSEVTSEFEENDLPF